MAEARTTLQGLPGVRQKSEEETTGNTVCQFTGYLLYGGHFGAKHKWR